MPRALLYLLNPAAASGRARAQWQRLAPALERRGLRGEVLAPGSRADLVDAAAQGARRGCTVVAVGGDGTVSDVLTGLARASAPAQFGILPLGTGNDAARLLGLCPMASALDALEAGTTRPLDAIEVTQASARAPSLRVGLVTAGAGFAAELLRFTPAGAKRWLGGPLAYTLGFFLALRQFKAADLWVEWDGRETRARALALVCANGSTAGAGTMHIAPGASMDDGLLDVLLVGGLGRMELALQFLRLMRGTHLTHPAVHHRQVRELRVEDRGNRRSPLQLDGTLVGTLPARLRVLPRLVQALVPPARLPAASGR